MIDARGPQANRALCDASNDQLVKLALEPLPVHCGNGLDAWRRLLRSGESEVSRGGLIEAATFTLHAPGAFVLRILSGLLPALRPLAGGDRQVVRVSHSRRRGCGLRCGNANGAVGTAI